MHLNPKRNSIRIASRILKASVFDGSSSIGRGGNPMGRWFLHIAVVADGDRV